MTPGQIACPSQVAPKNLGPLLTQEMVNYQDGQAVNPEITNGVKQVLDVCVKREHVAADQEDAYTKYIIARISHDDLSRQLATMKVPTAILDRVFDLGPGLHNPTPDEITEEKYNSVANELTNAGVNMEALPKDALTMMGSYVAVTGEMYRDMAAVR